MKEKFLVKDVIPNTGYPFKVISRENIGTDFQALGGPWYKEKDIAFCTQQDIANNIAYQLNHYGVLYFPGKKLHGRESYI